MSETHTLSARVRRHAAQRPGAPAFIEPARRIDWAGYDRAADRLAWRLVEAGLAPGARVAVWLPDGVALHVALLAAERAGVIALGIGARAGLREVRHLLALAGAGALISPAQHRGEAMAAVFASLRAEQPALRHHLVLDADDLDGPAPGESALATLRGRELGVDDVFLLNTTSGTTGMPKCVVHDQARWFAFHDEAVAAAEFGDDEVFLAAAPPPFGFGLWTSHVTPTVLGAPTVILPQFDAAAALASIGEHGVTTIAAVSTQFVMMLDSPAIASADFSRLRTLFTGGEMVPYARALEFERRTGAVVLQFYGSNETGAFSKTTRRDTPEWRLTTAGRLLAGMDVRLFDDDGHDVTAAGRGQPGGRGPLLSRGYYNDAAANARLYGPGGYMLMEDIVELDAHGYLRVVGRKGDFIIRGGKNISCAAVEQAAAAHPAVALAAAVAAPDAVLGERTMLFVTTKGGAGLTLAELTAFLEQRQVSRELFPEYLQVCAELPRSAGAKIAKGELRDRARAYVESTADTLR